jgi:Ser/Thr protein kinase RdoA (MazF antagonist)
MTIPLESIPSVTPAAALELAKTEYGLTGTISALPSERDQNFLISGAKRLRAWGGAAESSRPHGGKFVLKIANSHDPPELLDFQNQAMRRVRMQVADLRVPQVQPTLEGLEITRIHDARTGSDHHVRVLDWIDGDVLAKSASRGPALFESIGSGMARVDAALRGFSHPAMHRILQWDLRRAGMARENAQLLPADKQTQVERLFSLWERIAWTDLRHGVIHGDANDYNIIAGDGRMLGLLDFGDMVYTATVCDLAIALAYVMLDEREPLRAAAQVIRAYQRSHPLTAAEQQALYPLILSRLAMSVCYAAHNKARNPGDPYQVVTEAAAWHLLDRLAPIATEEALVLIRAACAAP